MATGKILLCGATLDIPVRVSSRDFKYLLSMGKWLVTHPGDRNRKGYAYRHTYVNGRSKLIWMHKVVLLRAKGPPPHPDWFIGDHLNGDPWDNRREMLRWATVDMNNRNRHGWHYRQFDLWNYNCPVTTSLLTEQ